MIGAVKGRFQQKRFEVLLMNEASARENASVGLRDGSHSGGYDWPGWIPLLFSPLGPWRFGRFSRHGASCGRLPRQFSSAANGRAGGRSERFPAQRLAEALDSCLVGRAWTPLHSLIPSSTRKDRKRRNGLGQSQRLLSGRCCSGASRVAFRRVANSLRVG